jgi:putative flippase GtrA
MAKDGGRDSLFLKMLRSPTDSLFIQLARYVVVGGLAFVVDFGSLFLLTEFGGLHYLLSAAIAFCLGLVTNYLLSIVWVFNRRTLNNRWLEFLIFGLIGLAGLGMNELILWFLTDRVGLHYLVSKMVSAVLVLLWNFLARRFSLFR